VTILPLFVALYEFYFFQNLDLSPRGKKILLALIAILFVLGIFGFIIWGERYINVIIEGYAYRTFTMSERVLTQFRIVLLLCHAPSLPPSLSPQSGLRFPHIQDDS